MSTLGKPKFLPAFRILIDCAIAAYLIGILVLLFTGGFKVTFLGLTIKSSSLSPLLGVLIPLILLRLVITIDIRNFLLLLTSVLIGLFVVEIFLRIWNPLIAQPGMVQIHRASDIYDWELIPGASGVGMLGERIHVNSAGFRDVEHSLEKTPGVERIAVIGDSFTFGMGVNLEDAYPKQLERIINNKGIRTEVLGFGVIGYNMWQYLELLKRKVLAYQPDLVIVGFFMDDIEKPVAPYRNATRWQGHNPFETLFPDESNFSYLWNFLKNFNHLIEVKYRYRRGYKYLQGIQQRKEELGPDNPQHAYHKIEYGKLEAHIYAEFRNTLQEFAQILRNHKIPAIFALIPDASQLHEHDRQTVNRFLEQATADTGFPLLDLTPAFEKAPDPRLLYLFPLDAHTSPQGHNIIAAELARKIMDVDLLSP